MKTNKMKMISNILFYASVGFAIFVLIITYIDREKLPPGICPIQDNQNWMIIAIGLLIATTIISSVVEYKLKKEKREEVIEEVSERHEDLGTQYLGKQYLGTDDDDRDDNDRDDNDRDDDNSDDDDTDNDDSGSDD